ncbi:MAG: hypothetical protein JSR61_19585 [Proteobacteria bacterium]|nr:hypothetical protein [Pseudomonadota bacterium]
MKTRIPIAATVVTVMAVSSLGMNTALAAPPHASLPSMQNDAQVIQVASKKKHRRVHRGNPAAAAAVLGLFGAIAGMAAQDAYRDRYYYDDGYYYGGPGPVYHSAPRYHHQYYGGRGPGPFNGGQSVYPNPRYGVSVPER